MTPVLHQASVPRKLCEWCAAHPFLATFVYLLLVSLLFLAVPALDLMATGLFYDAEAGFWLAEVPFFVRLRALGPYLVKVVAVLAVLPLLAALLLTRLPEWVRLRASLFLLSTLVLGPGLVVNALFKNNWGRPRPRDVTAFGGDAPYVPVWKVTDHCDTNCSFVSGEASASLWLVSLVFLAPRCWRLGMLAVIGPLCAALSFNRVAFGGHFLSDTLLSWGLTLLVILAMYRLFYVAPPAMLQEASLRSGLARVGGGLRRAGCRLACGLARRTRAFLHRFR